MHQLLTELFVVDLALTFLSLCQYAPCEHLFVLQAF